MKIHPEKLKDLAEITNASLHRHLVPGAAIALLVSGKTYGTFVYGEADPERKIPVTEDTHFEAASLTKPVFAKIIHQLITEEKLDLDTPLFAYAPDTLPTDDPRREKITPRHILSHGTGLPGWGNAPLPLLFSPGTSFSYSGKAYTALQDAVEKLTSRRIDDLMQTEIFNSLGMEDAAMIWTGPLNRTLARTVDEKGMVEEKRSRCQRSVALEPNCAFSLYVTIKDYPRFLESILHDTAFLQMVTSAKNSAGHGVCWGLGFGMYQDLLWHWGDNGGFKSFVCIDPLTGDGLLIHTNGANGLEVCYDIASHVCDFDFFDIKEMVAHAE